MRGFLKRRRQRRVIDEHLRQHGGFQFHGRDIQVPSDLALGIQSIIADGSYEAAECALIERFLKHDEPVIELGGCLGLVSSFVAGRLSPETKLIVVEANPALLETCRHNATLGGTRAASEVVAKAVAYDGDTVSFGAMDNVHVSRLGGGADAVQVDATTLRDLVAMLDAPAGYTLICDIEGAEIDLLEKDAGALATCNVVVMELHPAMYAATGHSLESVIDLVRRAGLEVSATEENVYAFQRPEAVIS